MTLKHPSVKSVFIRLDDFERYVTSVTIQYTDVEQKAYPGKVHVVFFSSLSSCFCCCNTTSKSAVAGVMSSMCKTRWTSGKAAFHSAWAPTWSLCVKTAYS